MLLEAVPADAHAEPAELHVDVRPLRQRLDRFLPDRENLVALVAVDRDRPAAVIEHDLRVGNRVRERDQLVELRMIHPRIERVAEPCERLHALAEFRVRHHARHRRIAGIAHTRIGVPRRDVADAAEAPAAGAIERGEHRLDAAAEHHVGIADDAGAGADLSVDAARRHRGDAVDELDLADRLHLLRAVGAMHRARLHEHGRDDVVARIGVGEQVVEQIAPASRSHR